MGVTVAVAGASGYAGGELLRLLAAHPQVELGPLTASDASVGQRIGDVHPQLVTLAERTLTATTPTELGKADLVFLALPHGASGALAAGLAEQNRIIDLGADHRLADAAAWSRYYPGHAPSEPWVYALPELPGVRDAIAGTHRVAVPGCHPTAVILGLAPLVAAGLVDASDITSVSISGTSGAGAAPSRRLLGSEVMGDLTPYKVGVHQHTPEIAQALGIATLSFTPVLAPLPRGILATSSARLRAGVSTADLTAAIVSAYAGAPFVTVLPTGQWPRTASVTGSNSAHLQVVADHDADRAVMVAAIDNLGKGAAGQAVQAMNIMLGFDETTGLAVNGVAP